MHLGSDGMAEKDSIEKDLEAQLFELERISLPHKICKKIYLGD